jgi:hypothetical protein
MLVAGRRWGKTTLALHKMLRYAAAGPKRLCYYLAPTMKQAREIGWRPLLDSTPREIVRRIKQSDLEIELKNHSVIRLCGPSHLRGAGLDFCVLDEFAHFVEPELWPEVIRPMLADRKGSALIASTPAGLNHFYDLFTEAHGRPEWATFHYPTRQGGFISENELELLRSSMDARLYAQEIDARFEPHEGRVYYAFSRDDNVREVSVQPQLPLLVGVDFNVGQMTAIIAQKLGDECWIQDEIVIFNSNTFELLEVLTNRYPQKGVVHPDPTGFARKTSAQAGVTDHGIIQQFGWYVHATKPYPIVNRINGVNSLLRNVNGRTRLFVHPRCKQVIRSLEALTYKKGTPFPDKSTNLDHAADALGYLVGAVFPLIDPNGWRVTNAFTGADLTV